MTDALSLRPPFAPAPVTLEGRHVRLEPLALHHAEGLIAAGNYDSIWHVTSRPPLESVALMRAFIDETTALQRAGVQVPFVIVHIASNSVVGATRWLDISHHDRRLEIGYTWITPAHQRSPVNTEAKYLQLEHLFETHGAIRVQFKTDLRNTQSQRALEGIGATREGVLRRHMVVRDGYVRDSVFYGITDEDWPRVRRWLEKRLSTNEEA